MNLLKLPSYNLLCPVLLIFLVSFCIDPDDPPTTPDTDPIAEIPISDTTKTTHPGDTIQTPTVPTTPDIYKLAFYIGLDTIPAVKKDTLFGLDVIRIDAKLKNLTHQELIDYSQVEIKQTEGTGIGGTMLVVNKGNYLEITLSIDKITTESVSFEYDVYYKGQKTQHLSHELFQSWIGYTLKVMHAQYHENGVWKANQKASIKPTEQYQTYYKTIEKFALYKGSTKVSPTIHNYYNHAFGGRTQLEPGDYPEYYHEFGGENGKHIKFPVHLSVDGTILDVWSGTYIIAENTNNGEKAEIKIYRNGTKWSYDITFEKSVGRTITKWEGGEASLSTIPVTLEHFCSNTKSQFKHLGTISLHEVRSEPGRTHRPITGAVYLWLMDGKHYITSEYSPCGPLASPQSRIVLSLETGTHI